MFARGGRERHVLHARLGGAAPSRLIRRIADAGHELASHGWDHARVFRMTPTNSRMISKCSRKAIEDAGGQAVSGYRAPSFSIDARTPWAHEVLAEQGYAYSPASRRLRTITMAGAKRRALPSADRRQQPHRNSR
jgi:peptidoglycan/xylan/chitin deacetylase (PgdA/CDA1 family)